MDTYFSDKRILVTGACGTVGGELVRQLVETYDAKELLCMDNDESGLFFLEKRFGGRPGFNCFVGDVRDKDKLLRLMRGMDTVFHTAAFKHVIICERSPFEAVQTNIIGVQNVISAAIESNVSRVIFTSSDKAVNPTNVMGTSKLMGERLMTAANSLLRGKGPVFASTRFGNVLGSSGSVIPVFREQIRKGGPVTLTSEEMTRFVMSVSAAVRLVIDSAKIACGGEVFITKMPAIWIKDLASVMIERLAPEAGFDPSKVETKIIGVYPGEKMYEELMSREETRRAWELKDYFVVLPAFSALYRKIDYDYPDVQSRDVNDPYVSSDVEKMPPSGLLAMLDRNGLL